MASENERAAKLIDTAVEILEATGWCRGDFGQTDISRVDEDGRHCAVGALQGAAHILKFPINGINGPGDQPYLTAVIEINKQIPGRYYRPNNISGIIVWNDCLGPKDKPKVIRAFRRAAKALRAR
jgi:hypothetical protein